MATEHRYFILNKPYNMVSQFISDHPARLLCHLDYIFPDGTHAIGRLDADSEGLLLLTTNSKVTKLLFEGKKKHQRTYKVLVLHKVSEDALNKIRTGVTFKARGGAMYTSLPCEAAIIDEPNFIFPSPYIQSQYHDYTWLQLTLTEGKYRQVRKMVVTVGHKCMRLVRTSIEDVTIDGMQAGEVKEVDENTFFELLKIEYGNVSCL
jgi:23S rRNA pseudouridine2457 synthase